MWTLGSRTRLILYRTSTFLLTYLAYTAYHLSRKPLSIVKISPSFLECQVEQGANFSTCSSWVTQMEGQEEIQTRHVLCLLDTAFLLSYAFSMFFSGMLADNINLRTFLTVGMVISGIFTALFGLGQIFKIRSIWFFFCVRVFSGLFQSTGWPGVVSVMANWFGKGERGFVMAIWNSHTSLGNVLGSLIAGYYVSDANWGNAFLVPGFILILAGLVISIFLVPNPADVGLGTSTDRVMYEKLDNKETKSLIRGTEKNLSDKQVEPETISEGCQAVGFWKALQIQGVVEFSLCLFFAKLVSYTFLYWLPNYIHTSSGLGAEQAANLSTVFDIGGIIGAVLAGVISDKSGRPATTCCLMLGTNLPLLFLYQRLTIYCPIKISEEVLAEDSCFCLHMLVLLVMGVVVNGPYALISTAVSTELGQHPSLTGSSKALATVTAIIDGTGSMGAVVGPLLAGYLSSSGNWDRVFQLLMAASLLAVICLVRQVKTELESTWRWMVRRKGPTLYMSNQTNYSTFA